MVYLTLTKEKGNKNLRPIAIIKGDDKKYNNKFLYLDDSDKTGETKFEVPFCCKFNLIPSADENKRNIWYIAGASGSGKSYIAKQIAENYHKMYPERPIYIISKLLEDDTLDSMKAKPIRLDHSDFVDNPPDINKLSNSLVIFDDYDTIDGAEGKAVQTLIEDIAIMGRGHNDHQGNISMMCLSHYLSNYKKTRLILNEADHYILYPQATSANAMYYLLKTYLGMEREDMKRLKKLGRWVAIHKNYPQYMISQYTAELLHQD